MRDSAATPKGPGAGILLWSWMGVPQGFGTSGTPPQYPSHRPAQAVLGTGEGMELLLLEPSPVSPFPVSPFAPPSAGRARSL